ncbi:ABC transporter substrate-binding protein [Acinetobacter sp. YH12103]|uniref:ABC transporter substrate-binding protein n=1 Tax=Acinetobacter sp. YH12103 TaxID=2601092 RepID=UPI0015D18B5A|nr:ABC transporter substrate-binding protein [Acinetobacter sp. YH12103]
MTVLALTIGSGEAVLAKSPAQSDKVLNIAFEAPDDGFDMVKTYNFYSGSIAEAIFEPLLRYDYLARPATLTSNTAEALPKIEQEGKVYTFKIKPGIYFSADPAFKGKKRELVVEDYIYSMKRVMDPKNHSPTFSFIEGKILGADAAIQQAKSSGQFNYDAPIAGLKALDQYTLQITLTRSDFNFPYIMAYVTFSGTAREVIEHYGARAGQHPVGTGPYQLHKYVPRSRIELKANPDYRGFSWNFKGENTAWDQRLVKEMSGKKMPQIGRVKVSIIEEEQSRWLALKSGQMDYDRLTASGAEQALVNKQLKNEYKQKGILHYPNKDAEITYTIMNMRDPVVGGNTLEKIALRRAIALSYNQNEAIKQLYKGHADKAEMIIPEGVNGHNPAYKNSIAYNPLLANKLLERFGYKKGADGYRTLPDGTPLTLKMNSTSSSSSVIAAELWKKNLDAVGLRIEFKISNFADNLKEATQCKHMLWGGAWIADYPEGENFAQLLYGPNAQQGNLSCYTSKAYDALYQAAMKLPPDQRTPYYEKMNRQIEADNPWILHNTRVRNWLIHPQVQGFKAHPIMNSVWQYLDIEPVKK